MADIELFAGDTLIIPVTIKDAAGDEVDITDATALRFAFARADVGPALLEKAIGDGIELTGPALGECEITLGPADTEDMPQGFYYFEAEITLDGVVSTIATGTLQIKPTLIRPPA